jgi:anti-sigma factor RsiW
VRIRRDKNEPDAELAALADGSLGQERRPALEARVESSTELAALLEEQERAVALVRRASAEVEAPESLRRRIEEVRRGRARPTRQRRVAFGAGLAAAAAVAIALALTLPGGPAAPSLAQAAGLAALPATAGAPAPQPGQPKLLDATMGSLAFPNWLEKFGWKATGLRTDTIGGRDATTVFYEKNGKRIGYTIVDGDPLDVPGNAGRARREGTDLRILEIAGRPVVTWERQGKTCILTGSAEPGVLAKLAAWKGKGAVPF